MKKHVALENPESIGECLEKAKAYEQIDLLEEGTSSAESLMGSLRQEAKEAKAAAVVTSDRKDRKDLQEIKETLALLQETIKILTQNQQGNGQTCGGPQEWQQGAIDGDHGGACMPRQTNQGQNMGNNQGNSNRNRTLAGNNVDNTRGFAPACSNENYIPRIEHVRKTANGGERGDRQGNSNAIQTKRKNEAETKQKLEHRGKVLYEIKEYFRMERANKESKNNNTLKKANATRATGTDMSFKGTIEQVPVIALLDTGSEIGIINEDCFNKIHPRPKILKSRYDSVVAVNGSESEIKGSIEVPMVIGDLKANVTLNILTACNYDVILGRNFILEYVETIDVGNKEVSFRREKGKLKKAMLHGLQTKANRDTKGVAKVAQKVIFEPHETIAVEVYPTKNLLAKKLRFRSSENIENLGWQAKDQVVSGLTGTVKVSINNDTNSKRTLYPNKRIGTFDVVKTVTAAAVTAVKGNQAKVGWVDPMLREKREHRIRVKCEIYKYFQTQRENDLILERNQGMEDDHMTDVDSLSSTVSAVVTKKEKDCHETILGKLEEEESAEEEMEEIIEETPEKKIQSVEPATSYSIVITAALGLALLLLVFSVPMMDFVQDVSLHLHGYDNGTWCTQWVPNRVSVGVT